MGWKQKYATFKEMLDYGRLNYPGNIAMANPVYERYVRYDALAGAVEDFSKQINAQIDTDERFVVSAFSENRMEWMLVFISAVYGHNIFAPINHQIKDVAEIRRLILLSDIKIIFIEEQSRELFDSVINDWPADAPSRAPLIFIMEEMCTPVIDKYAPKDDNAKKANRPPRRMLSAAEKDEILSAEEAAHVAGEKKRATPDDFAILLFTSGSIKTKGVMLSQRALLSNQQGAGELLGVAHDNEIFVAGLPLSHSYGLLCGFVPLSFGSTAVYAPTPRAIADYISASVKLFPEKGILAAGVPELARIMNQRIVRSVKSGGGKNAPFMKRLLVNIKYGVFLCMRRVNYHATTCFGLDFSSAFFKPIKAKFGNEFKLPIGGGPIDKITEYGLRGVGFRALGGYGTTEMAPLVAANETSFKKIMSGSIGHAPNGVEIMLIDGEVCARGPNMMIAYLDNEEATKKAMPGDGWYHTGDKGSFVKRSFFGKPKPANYPPDYIYTSADDDGFLVLKGRVDNQFANHRGENIFPEEIEQVLLNNPEVSSCRVFESPATHVRAQIFPDLETIEIKLGKKPSEDDIKGVVSQIVRHANITLQGGRGIDDFEIRDADFERNAFGKIKRRGVE